MAPTGKRVMEERGPPAKAVLSSLERRGGHWRPARAICCSLPGRTLYAAMCGDFASERDENMGAVEEFLEIWRAQHPESGNA
jgi:hypothetical protein